MVTVCNMEVSMVTFYIFFEVGLVQKKQVIRQDFLHIFRGYVGFVGATGEVPPLPSSRSGGGCGKVIVAARKQPLPSAIYAPAPAQQPRP